MLISSTIIRMDGIRDVRRVSNGKIDFYLRNRKIIMVVDKRDRKIKRIYNDMKTARHYLQIKP